MSAGNSMKKNSIFLEPEIRDLFGSSDLFPRNAVSQMIAGPPGERHDGVCWIFVGVPCERGAVGYIQIAHVPSMAMGVQY